MTTKFKISRDEEGTVAYGLDDIIKIKRYGATLGAGEETWIVLEDSDGSAIYLPSLGAFFVGSDSPTIYPSTSSAEMQQVNSVQNISTHTFNNWPFSTVEPTEKRLYIKSEVAQTICVLILEKG
jgi:hypothetical protein